MSTRTDSRVGPVRTNEIEIIAATRIRRPCTTFLQSGLGAQEKNDLVEYLKSL
jgi:hypothetical protein